MQLVSTKRWEFVTLDCRYDPVHIVHVSMWQPSSDGKLGTWRDPEPSIARQKRFGGEVRQAKICLLVFELDDIYSEPFYVGSGGRLVLQCTLFLHPSRK